MANAKEEVRGESVASETSGAKIDMKFEIVVIPVSDVVSAKEFNERLGWRPDGAVRRNAAKLNDKVASGSSIFSHCAT